MIAVAPGADMNNQPRVGETPDVWRHSVQFRVSMHACLAGRGHSEADSRKVARDDGLTTMQDRHLPRGLDDNDRYGPRRAPFVASQRAG